MGRGSRSPSLASDDSNRDRSRWGSTVAAHDAGAVDALERLAFGLVAITSRAIEEVSAGELTLQQWRVLVVLGGVDDGLRVSEVARRITASGPSTSRIAHRLEQRGLLTHRSDPDDRRAVRLQLSPAGVATRARIVEHRRRLIGETLTGVRLSPAAARHLEAIAAVFDRWV